MARTWTNQETGERFVATSARDWRCALDEWRADRARWRERLEPAARRAARNGRWTLYHRAERAMYARALPCPMPAGHVMFSRRVPE